MNDAGMYISYSIGVFVVVFLSGCAVNLLKQHFIFQLTGIAFFFTYAGVKLTGALLPDDGGISLQSLYFSILPAFSAISACLISMVLGFWIFPLIRRKFKE